jgi:hypothetical protein
VVFTNSKRVTRTLQANFGVAIFLTSLYRENRILLWRGDRCRVPTISTFYGILIQMFWSDHAPPHFHALYAEHEVLIDIRTLDILEGEMPRRALALILEWAQEHRAELIEDWELCTRNQPPKKIQPLT